jgi:hypothetical protein
VAAAAIPAAAGNVRALAAALAIALLGASPAPATPAIGDILQSVGNARKGLTSYIVPVTMHGSVHVKILSVPFSMHGTEYYQAPDKQALHMVDVPKMAEGFSNMVGSLGTPSTWPQTYAISLQGTKAYAGRQDYVLIGVPRKSGNVKNVTVLVNPNTWAIDSAAFAYNNGSSVSLTLSYGSNSYNLPVSANVSAKFPDYSGGASIDYAAYQTNVPVPASAFQQ